MMRLYRQLKCDRMVEVVCCQSHILLSLFFVLLIRRPLRSTLFPYTTLFRSGHALGGLGLRPGRGPCGGEGVGDHVFEDRSEEHTSELQSRFDLVCRLLLEKKKKLAQQLLSERHLLLLDEQTHHHDFTAVD